MSRLEDPASKHERELMTCVHCGLCLNACPTYLVTGSEADSPRGRIVLMAAMHRGELGDGDIGARLHLDRCLGCRACEVACPSGVPYGSLVEVARASLNKMRPVAQRAARFALLESLTDPARMRLSLTVSRLAGGMPSPFARLLTGEPGVVANAPLPAESKTPALPAVIPARGPRRARVGMLVGCVMRVLYGDVNEDTAVILAANGCEVVVNQRQGCCGALHLHNGFDDRGLVLARKMIDAFTPFDGLDAIVVNSAGCGSTMKEYGHLLAEDDEYAERARRFSEKVKDVSEYLDELGWNAPMREIKQTVTYHDACHLGHAQRITEAPRRLIQAIPGLTLVPLTETDVCCGSAGIYNLTEPTMSLKLRDRKVANILATGARTVVTSNPGCMAWINSGVDNIGVIHPATLLRQALQD
ncbi:MAG: heterodisulfide reductase-related iron-sulfur binding cluster [Capsulimonadaceae bacterium]|nr:heterodisulfide reductase-related iron-sulfur binding cluster [Capsulimonadaceae bacterium]